MLTRRTLLAGLSTLPALKALSLPQVPERAPLPGPLCKGEVVGISGLPGLCSAMPSEIIRKLQDTMWLVNHFRILPFRFIDWPMICKTLRIIDITTHSTPSTAFPEFMISGFRDDGLKLYGMVGDQCFDSSLIGLSGAGIDQQSQTFEDYPRPLFGLPLFHIQWVSSPSTAEAVRDQLSAARPKRAVSFNHTGAVIPHEFISYKNLQAYMKAKA